MATKTPKTPKTEDHAQVLRDKMLEAQGSTEVAPVANVEVTPAAVEVVAPTPAPTETPEENQTMNTTPNTPEQSAEVPDLRTPEEKIVQLLALHAGIGSDIEATQNILDGLRARQSEVFGSLAVYRSELDGSKLTAEDAEAKIKAVADALAQKFGPMGAGMVGLFFSGFEFKAPAGLNLTGDTAGALGSLLGVGEPGADVKPDFSGLAQAIRAHILTTAGPMADSVRPMLDSVFLELKMIKVAPTTKDDDDEGKQTVLKRKNFVLDGYPDKLGYSGAAGKVMVTAKNINKTSFGGKSAQQYLKRVGYPEMDRGLRALWAMLDAWAVEEGLIKP